MDARSQELTTALSRGAADWNGNRTLNVGTVRLGLSDVDFSSAPHRVTGFDGYVFNCPVEFTKCIFPDAFVMNQVNFHGDAIFRECSFQGKTDFVASTFGKGLTIDGSRFGGDFVSATCTIHGAGLLGLDTTFFGSATFNVQGSACDLKGAIFERDMTFKGQASDLKLTGCTFHRNVILSGTWITLTVKGLNLERSKIAGNLLLGNFRSEGHIDLTELTIGGSLLGGDMIVKGFFSAPRAVISGFVSLGASNEENSDYDFPMFEFNDARIGNAADFSNRTFSRETNFHGTVFGLAPAFHNAKLHQDTNFDSAQFPDTKSYNAERCYRTLKLAMNAHQAHREELDFFALELKSRAAKETRWAFRLLYWVYEKCSDYGRSIWRPVASLFILAIISIAVYAAIYESATVWYCVPRPTCKLVFDRERLSALASLSLNQTLPFVALLKEGATSGIQTLSPHHPPFIAQLWAILQGVAGVALVFLTALGLRNLFRLK